MSRIKKILAPTDLSGPSQAGVGYALDLAKALGAEVTAYHVVGGKALMQRSGRLEEGTIADTTLWQAERLLRSYQLALARFLNEHFSELIPWVKIREKVEFGVPESSIVEWAKREGSDLIVISICPRNHLSPTSARSVADKIVHNAPCPVLSIHSGMTAKESRKVSAVA